MELQLRRKGDYDNFNSLNKSTPLTFRNHSEIWKPVLPLLLFCNVARLLKKPDAELPAKRKPF